MGLGEEGKDQQATRTKGISMVSFGGGGNGSPYHPSGYPPHTGPHYPVQGYPVPASPPPEYPGYGGGYRYESNGYSHQTDYHSQWPQPGYHSLPHILAPPPAYGHDAYPYQYGGQGGYGGYGKHQQQYHGGYGGYGKHHEEHADYYHRHEEVDMYHHQQGYGGGYNNHGYGKHQYGIVRGISNTKV